MITKKKSAERPLLTILSGVKYFASGQISQISWAIHVWPEMPLSHN